MQSKLIQALHSRTLWTTLVMLIFNFIPQLNVDQALKDLINSILVLVIGYFHLNPLVPGAYSIAGVVPPIAPVVVDTATENIVQPIPKTPVV
jgi:hypothetical protein